MEKIEVQINDLLEGQVVSPGQDLLCDFTLEDQNSLNDARGLATSVKSDYLPRVKQTVTYIVVGLLFNEEGEVLMMQEAKSSCAGQWYLPAGRIEPGEEIEDAVRREVLEETGLLMEPSTLLMLEIVGGSWYRFVFTGKVTGGTLKTPKDADSESLQAKWVRDVNELSLRASDVNAIIERGRAYLSWSKTKGSGEPWHQALMPIVNSHKKLHLRLLVCIKKRANNRLHVLVSEVNELHLPVFEIHPKKNLHSSLKTFMAEVFGAGVASHKPHGILTVEHSGKPEGLNDGLCVTVLVTFRVPLEEVGIIAKCAWIEVSKPLEKHILARTPRNMCVPLHVIR